jgi:hypothetical protein
MQVIDAVILVQESYAVIAMCGLYKVAIKDLLCRSCALYGYEADLIHLIFADCQIDRGKACIANALGSGCG